MIVNLTLIDVVKYTGKEIDSSDIAGLVGSLSKDHIQDVIAYFNSQLQMPAVQSIIGASSSTSNINGIAMNEISFSFSTLRFIGILTVSRSVLTAHTWIIYSGATHNVYHDKNLFMSISYD